MSKLRHVVFLLFLFWGCNMKTEVKTIKLAHGLDVNHPVHKAMFKMGKEVAKLSDGRLQLELFPNQQLGTEREVLELLQIGSLDMTKVSAATLENFAPNTRVLGLPYLFRSKQHAFAVLDGPIGEELLNAGQSKWLKGLCFYDAGSRSFYTKDKPVRRPEDLQGKKIRVMESTTAINMVRSFGGSPTPISWGELYTALQQGVVDGAENNPPSFYLSRHYEVCKYYALNEHTISPDVLVVSTHFWNALSSQEQKWLQKAAKESVVYQRTLWAKAEAEALSAVKEAGVQVIMPEKAAFSKKVEVLYKEFKKDKVLYGLIERIKNEKYEDPK